MKKSFVLHKDSTLIFKKLTNEQAGILIKAIIEYQLSGNLPPDLDPVTDLIITPFINQFQRDHEKWVNVAERNKENGLKGGRPKTQNNPVGYLGTQNNPNEPRKAVSVSVSVSDSVSDIYNYWNLKTNQNLTGDKKIISDLKVILKTYSVEEVKTVIDYIVKSQWYVDNGQVLLSVIAKPTKFSEKLDRAKNSKVMSSHDLSNQDYARAEEILGVKVNQPLNLRGKNSGIK